MFKLTVAKMQMIEEAQKAGYTVRWHEGCVDVIRLTNHAKPRVSRGLRIWANGSAFDFTMDLSVAKSIRNVDDQRKMLGL